MNAKNISLVVISLFIGGFVANNISPSIHIKIYTNEKRLRDLTERKDAFRAMLWDCQRKNGTKRNDT